MRMRSERGNRSSSYGFDKNLRRVPSVNGCPLRWSRTRVFCLLGIMGLEKPPQSTSEWLLPPDPSSPEDGGRLRERYRNPEAIHSLRRVLGVCPQHDVLFPHLTLREHVAFLASSKVAPRVGSQRRGFTTGGLPVI